MKTYNNVTITFHKLYKILKIRSKYNFRQSQTSSLNTKLRKCTIGSIEDVLRVELTRYHKACLSFEYWTFEEICLLLSKLINIELVQGILLFTYNIKEMSVSLIRSIISATKDSVEIKHSVDDFCNYLRMIIGIESINTKFHFLYFVIEHNRSQLFVVSSLYKQIFQKLSLIFKFDLI